MQGLQEISFGNYYNALKTLHGSINLSNPKFASQQTEMSSTKNLSPIHEIGNKQKNNFTTIISQSSILDSFMESQPKKKIKMRKNQSINNKSLLDEFLTPKQIREIIKDSQKITVSPEQTKEEVSIDNNITQLSLESKKPTKKFVDLNLFKKKRRPNDDQQKQNMHSNIPIKPKPQKPAISNQCNNMEIQDILEGSKKQKKSSGKKKKNIMNSEYFNLCETYNSTFYEKTQLSAVKEQDIEESIILNQIPKNIKQSTDQSLHMANISEIFPRANLSFEEQQQFLDLEKFVVDDLKMDISLLCQKLNESGIHNQNNAPQEQQFDELEFLPEIKSRLDTLKKRILSDCPFIQQ